MHDTKTSIEQSLLSLQPTTTASQIWPFFPVIEQLLQKGVSYRDIITRLGQAGIDVKPSYFKLLLHRYRKRKAAQAQAAPKSHSPASSQPEGYAVFPHLPPVQSTSQVPSVTPATPPSPTSPTGSDASSSQPVIAKQRLAATRGQDIDLNSLAHAAKPSRSKHL